MESSMIRMLNVKTFLILCLLIIHVQLAFGQQNDKPLPEPPNCVKLHDNLFIDKTEIDNIHWLEYVYYLKRDSSNAAYTAALPDTTVWLVYKDTAKYETYLRLRSFRDFPVVGVTHQQAENYCRWRSQAVTSFSKSEEKRKRMNLQNDQQAIFTFRLPTEKEWIEAAAGSLDQNTFPYGYVDFMSSSSLSGKPIDLYEKTDKTQTFKIFKADLKRFNKGKNEPMFNVIKQFNNYFLYGDNAPRISRDKKSVANTLGLFDMIGNVAEFVEEPGFSKGGGWAHYLNAAAINRRQPYSKPEAWLGFRCVCEVEIKTVK